MGRTYYLCFLYGYSYFSIKGVIYETDFWYIETSITPVHTTKLATDYCILFNLLTKSVKTFQMVRAIKRRQPKVQDYFYIIFLFTKQLN